ncbi:hypothetical protein RvY_02703-2 [Ramazzottius varieornatus]|uniref:MYND-type domain-containing protein n=1 Tax=Ramazzottius varieornatus TaxID=947166 RepID=A0A1D1URG3_RAMVA|nr:hypothetical protein RvY_02703-2 [Ramazzottius varieornatus]
MDISSLVREAQDRGLNLADPEENVFLADLVDGKSDFAYKVGDTVFKCEPWIFSLYANKLRSHCYHCLRRPDIAEDQEIRRCMGCRFAGYCSENCQIADWKNRHKPECAILKGIIADKRLESEGNLDRLLVLLKIMTKLKRKEKGSAPGDCTPESPRTFDDLMSHEEEFLDLRPELKESYLVLKPYLDRADVEKKRKICPDFPTFIRLLGKFYINNFALYDLQHPNVVAVGRGIYLGPSILDHSCVPNALQVDVGKTVTIKVIRNIDKAENVRIAYISPFDLLENRKSYLEKRYFFTCDCPGCADPETIAKRNAMKCSNCATSIPLGAENLRQCSKTPACPQCNKTNQEAFHRALKSLAELRAFIVESKLNDKNTRKRSQDDIRALMSTACEVLASDNFVLGVAHHDAASRLLTLSGNLNEGMEHLLAAVSIRREHVRDYCYHPCFLIVKWLAQQERFMEAFALIAEVGDYFRLVVGENSQMYQAWIGNVFDL